MDKIQEQILVVLRGAGASYFGYLNIRDKINAEEGNDVSIQEVKEGIAKLEAAGKVRRPEVFCIADK